MKLADLEPRWWSGQGRVLGVSFLCPCCRRERLHIQFANPPDGGTAPDVHRTKWQRTGETFETLTLSPSVNAEDIVPGERHWHGWIRDGEAVGA